MSARRYLTLTNALDEAAEILLRRRHYRDFPEYVRSMIRYDGQTQMDHHLTAEWAAMTGEEQDRLDEGILAMVKAGKKVRGSWLLSRLEIITDIVWAFVESGQKPSPELVAKELAKREHPPKDPPAP